MELPEVMLQAMKKSHENKTGVALFTAGGDSFKGVVVTVEAGVVELQSPAGRTFVKVDAIQALISI